MRTDCSVNFHLSKLSIAKFSILYDIFLVRDWKRNLKLITLGVKGLTCIKDVTGVHTQSAAVFLFFLFFFQLMTALIIHFEVYVSVCECYEWTNSITRASLMNKGKICLYPTPSASTSYKIDTVATIKSSAHTCKSMLIKMHDWTTYWNYLAMYHPIRVHHQNINIKALMW